MKVLISASELSPFARTGGLGEAIAGIAQGVAGLGHDVTVVIPAYRHLRDEGEVAEEAGATFRTWEHGAYRVMALDEPELFDRPGIYGDHAGSAYEDQWRRFGQLAAMTGRLATRFDVLHLHDAHTGPAALAAPVPTVFTIHNAAYGIDGPLDEVRALIGAPAAAMTAAGPLEWWGAASFLKAGIVGADLVTTVSPSFALQLADDDTISGGMDVVIRSLPQPVRGILNGIDERVWDPQNDPALPAPYSAVDPTGRAASRRRLIELAGLDDGFLLGNVGRMSEQKGLGLLDAHLDELVRDDVRLVLVGSGELDGMVDEWAGRHPRSVWHAPYREDLSRLVSAGTDGYLMPSRFEPCGIGQMYAMRYGSVPIVRLTGGLADTVIDIDEHPDAATGFGFRLFEPIELAKTIRRARRTMDRDEDAWGELMRRGMTTDFSWDNAARHYELAYEDAFGR